MLASAQNQETFKGSDAEPAYTLPDASAVTLVKEDLYDADSIDPIYRDKARLISRAMQDIGMGKYQWWLFCVAGFGWFADSVWPLMAGLILSPVVSEFDLGSHGPFLSLAINIGLLVGAIFWGVGCDIWGRRWSFNLTLLVAGIFGLAAGGSPNFVTLASVTAVLGIGVGGNMPVDSAVFLDFVPAPHQYLLTLMSIWWSIGQLLASLVAWPLIANFSCPLDAPAGTCTRHANMGWRYLMFTLSALMLLLWALRFFAFPLFESPRYLVGKGRDAEAVAVVRKVAAFNGRPEGAVSLDEDQLRAVDEKAGGQVGGGALLAQGSDFSVGHVKALFKTRRMAWSTTLLIFLWGIIGLASTLYNSFLPFLLASRGAKFGDSSYFITYRNQVILAIIGVPGAFLAAYAVDHPLTGRRGTLAISSGLTGVFLFGSTTARTSNALLGWNCAYAFNSNIMYGVLYAMSPEIFPAKDRGTGNALTSTATRVFGVMAPIIALYANLDTPVPVYVSGALIMLAGLLSLALPYEPRGKASL
ncbi:MFS general substrate transporter [Punctularia strigosozonata HHB-11173 SS5]|uniref:MFS general substrate transporter n=1 Tax=Punctularia strigosozonata (strain HHB-11173) TaxID=741275 RepID=UPI0004417A3E|nr:MFS general substrate transporter [Punctularia strigosozonata HHB-11173 SS5]EIN05730.1 MFS general substrate transporter [Punctularia strigosozonata HHB-11173 SS5]